MPLGTTIGPANNFSVARMQREVGRSSYGAIFVNRQGTGEHAVDQDWNRAYGLDANIQMYAEPAASRRSSPAPTRPRGRRIGGQRLRRPRLLQLHQQSLADLRRVLAGRRGLQSRGRLPPSPRLPSSGIPRLLPATAEEHRVDPPRLAARLVQRVLRLRRQAAVVECAHSPVRDSAQAGRAVRLVHGPQPGQSDGAVRGLQPRRTPRRDSGWRVHAGCSTRSSTFTIRALASPAQSALASATTTTGTSRASRSTSDYRITEAQTASLGWTRQDIELPYG